MTSADRTAGTSFSRVEMAVAAAVLLFAFSLGLVKIWDFDTLWHLKTGELILRDRALPSVDPFSYTRAGSPWKLDEWGGELIFHLAQRAGGFSSLEVFVGILIALIAWVGFCAAKERGAHWLSTALFLIAALLGSRLRLTARPEIFSLLLAGTFVVHLLKEKHKEKIAIWTLPILQILWANLHPGATLGPMIAGLFLAAECISVLVGKPRGLRRMQRPAAIFLLTLLACLVNPYGTYIYKYGAEFASNPVFTQFLAEWAPQKAADFFTIAGLSKNIAYKIVLALTAAGLALNWRKAGAFDKLLFFFFLLLSLKAVRFTGVFLIVCAPIAAACWSSLLQSPLGALQRRPVAAALAIAATAALMMGLFHFQVYNGKRFRFGSGLSERVFPVEAADALSPLADGGRLYNDYGLGALVIYRMWPRLLVFIDGRCPLYGADFFRKHIDFERAPSFERWAEMESEYGFNLALLSTEQQAVGKILLARPDWALIYWDQRAAVFARRSHPAFNGTAPAEFIATDPWGLQAETTAYPELNPEQKQRLKNELERALALNEKNTLALRGIIKILLLEDNKNEAAKYIERFSRLEGMNFSAAGGGARALK